MLGANRTGNDCQQSSEQVKIRKQKTYHNSSGGGILHLPPFFILRWTHIDLLFCFFDSDFESSVRLAVSLGGDADTQAAIAGSIAEAYYGGVPKNIKFEVIKRLPVDFINVMLSFNDMKKL